MSAAEDRFKTACELFDSALRLYFEGNADFASLHLAGAAEELLGKHLRERDYAAFLDQLQAVMMQAWSTLLMEDPSVAERSSMSAAIIAEFMNHAKNHVKHSVRPASFDVRMEAREILARAFVNYMYLLSAGAALPDPSERMKRFEQDFIDHLSNEVRPKFTSP